NLFMKNPCRNRDSDYTSIIKHTLKDKKTISIICKMSDNNYYKFKGNPDENNYYPPQMIQLKSPIDGSMVALGSDDMLFKYTNGNYQIYTCDKAYTYYRAVIDDDGDIDYFISDYVADSDTLS